MTIQTLAKLDGKFQYDLDTDQQILYVEASGTYNDEETVLAFQAFNDVVSKNDPTKLTVVLKFNTIDYVDDDRADVIIETLKLYLNAGFPKVKMQTPDNLATRLQLEDAIEESGLSVELL